MKLYKCIENINYIRSSKENWFERELVIGWKSVFEFSQDSQNKK